MSASNGVSLSPERRGRGSMGGMISVSPPTISLTLSPFLGNPSALSHRRRRRFEVVITRVSSFPGDCSFLLQLPMYILSEATSVSNSSLFPFSSECEYADNSPVSESGLFSSPLFFLSCVVGCDDDGDGDNDSDGFLTDEDSSCGATTDVVSESDEESSVP